MPKYDGSKIEGISDADKQRLIAAYLSHNQPNNVDWDTAIKLAGSASKDSYKKMLAASLKKLVSVAGEGEDGETVPAPAPARAPKKGRKCASPATEGESVENKETKKAKKATKPRSKKAKQEAQEDANNEEVVWTATAIVGGRSRG